LGNDRELLGALGQMHVQTVETHVELTVAEPAIVRRGARIEHLSERLVPAQIALGELTPKCDVVLACAPVQRLELLRSDSSTRGKIRRRWEAALFVQHRADVPGGFTGLCAFRATHRIRSRA